jgi:hypothetical protein
MKIKSADIIYGMPFFVGLILQIFAVDLFRLTFISTQFSVGLYLLSGLIGYVLLRRKVQGTFKNKIFDLVISLTYCVVSIGGIFAFLFLATNYYFANIDSTKQTFPIVKTGTLGKGNFSRCRQPYVVIEKEKSSKEIIFKCNLAKDIAEYKSIDLTISKGAFGFDIIRSKQLNE